jgi:hypothetical protein
VVDYTPKDEHQEIHLLWPGLERRHQCEIVRDLPSWDGLRQADGEFDFLLVHFADIGATCGLAKFLRFLAKQPGDEFGQLGQRVRIVVGFSGGTPWSVAAAGEKGLKLEPFRSAGRFFYCKDRAEIEAWFDHSDPGHEAKLRLLYAMLDEDEAAIAAALGELKEHAGRGIEPRSVPKWSDREGVRRLREGLFPETGTTAP